MGTVWVPHQDKVGPLLGVALQLEAGEDLSEEVAFRLE